MLDDHRRSLLALLRGRETDWSLVTATALSGNLDSLIANPAVAWGSQSLLDTSSRADERLHDLRCEVEHLLEEAASREIGVLTVLDDGYPENLRRIPNPPPFLFCHGSLLATDARACAVVGTRQPSTGGRLLAEHWTEALVRRGLTIVSGLARGIDTCAHEVALRTGGRTIAVLGFGFNHMYPPENAGLADRIAESGAVVSQFWPDTPPSRRTFPIRNVVSSGLSLGTVVIEASHTSGARMQARVALEQGRAVMFPRELVMSQEWARRFVNRGARVIDVRRLEASENAGEPRETLGDERAGFPPSDAPTRLFNAANGFTP